MGLNIKPKHIVLDLYQNKYVMIQASQYDIDSRKLIIHVTSDGEFFKIPQNYVASIEYKKADNTIGVVDCDVLEDGTLSFTITDQMVAVAGYCKCDLLLASNKEAVNTNAFIINVRESAVQGDEYESKDEFTSLTKTITRARSAISTMSKMQDEFSGYVEESTKTIDHCLDQAERAQAIADQVDSAVLTAIEKAGETAINAKSASSSATAAQSSATKAKTSEDNAKISETNAKASEDLVKTYSDNAKASETNAKTSETNAQSAATSAQSSKETAVSSASTATTKANEASASATSASNSATLATTKANEMVDYADQSKSYAVGTDDEYRDNDSVDNARYYYEQAKSISEGLQGALLPMGTVTFSELATQSKVAGYMYNISDEFTTDDTFKEGSGHIYPLGTNVYYTADGYWDCLAGTPVTGIKGNAEATYRKGNVNITPANIGLGNVPNVATNDQTPTYTEATSNAKLTSGEKLSIAFGKISKAISSLISHLSNKNNPHEVTKTQVGLGNCDNTADADKNVKHATTADKLTNVVDNLTSTSTDVPLSANQGKILNEAIANRLTNIDTLFYGKYASATASKFTLDNLVTDYTHLLFVCSHINGSVRLFDSIIIPYSILQNENSYEPHSYGYLPVNMYIVPHLTSMESTEVELRIHKDKKTLTLLVNRGNRGSIGFSLYGIK